MPPTSPFSRSCATRAYGKPVSRERALLLRGRAIDIDGVIAREWPASIIAVGGIGGATPAIFSDEREGHGGEEGEDRRREAVVRPSVLRVLSDFSRIRPFFQFLGDSCRPDGPPPSATSCHCSSPPTIGGPLKLNSRGTRPQGRFCSDGSKINVSFKMRSRISPVIAG